MVGGPEGYFESDERDHIDSPDVEKNDSRWSGDKVLGGRRTPWSSTVASRYKIIEPRCEEES